MAENVNENEATVLQFDGAEDISLSDILYLIQGTGTDRDRQMTLEQLRDFLQSVFTDISFINENGGTSLKAGALKFTSGNGSLSVSFNGGVSYVLDSNSYSLGLEGLKVVNGDTEISVDADGVKVTDSTKKVDLTTSEISFSTKNGSSTGTISYDLSKFTVNKNFDFAGNVTVEKTAEFGSLATFNDTAIFKSTAAFKSNAVFNSAVGDVEIENASVVADVGVTAGTFLKAGNYVDAGNVCCSKIYEAAAESILKDPTSILTGCARLGAMALVKNGTGNDVYIDRNGDGTNMMHLVISPDEILLYVYNGSAWVHAW